MATTRRQLFFAAPILLSTALASAFPQEGGALEVTFYYLPG